MAYQCVTTDIDAFGATTLGPLAKVPRSRAFFQEQPLQISAINTTSHRNIFNPG
jgi:L-asparaginase/Glu-tRNA(Gln) amidotransferase subunit D